MRGADAGAGNVGRQTGGSLKVPIKTGRNPAQFGLFATPLEAMIPADAEVRVISAFVDQLDLSTLGFKCISSQGASAYSSEVML
jgi:transposase